MSLSKKTFVYTCIASICIIALSAPLVFANHTWGNYHWARTTASFDLQVGNNMGPEWQNAYHGALVDWSVSTKLNLVETGKLSKRSCRGRDGFIEACSDSYGNTGWLGLAQIWVSGDHIVKGTAKMNDYYYSDSYANGFYNTDAWRNLVTCQEIAHAFGLGHQDEAFDNANLGTCMDYTNNPDTNQHPNQHDYEMLETMYAHLDTFDSYVAPSGGTSDGGGKPERCNPWPACRNGASVGQRVPADPGSWGRAVAYDASGNPSVFVQELGGGEKLITHVFWTIEHNDHDHTHEGI